MDWTHATLQTATQRADMVAAQRRSELYGVDRCLDGLPYRGELRPATTQLYELARPVLDDFIPQIDDSSLGLVLAGRDGQVAFREAGERSTLRTILSHNIDVGFSLAEPDAGTNGAGTSLETRRPALVVGSDHFVETFHPFACASAPIIHPISHKVLGTVGMLCSVDDANSLLLPTVVHLSRVITQRALAQSTIEERILLDAFVRARRRVDDAVATLNDSVLIASPSAQDLLQGVDQADLWDAVSGALRDGHRACEIERMDRAPLLVTCTPIHDGSELVGAELRLSVRHDEATRHARRQQPPRFGALVGVSDHWRAVVRSARHAAGRREPVLVVGEPGTGRLSIAEAIVEAGDRVEPVVFDSADVLLTGAQRWMADCTRALESGATVILRRLDHLSTELAAAAASKIASNAGGRVLGTSESARSTDRGVAALLAQLDVLRIEVGPLRERREDIPAIIRALAGRDGQGIVSPEAIAVLCRQPWPGNVTEVRQALRSGFSRANNRPLSIEHLPSHVRRTTSRLPLHGLRQQEAEAIVAAIDAAGGNKSQAADDLGISRATLYRRLAAYGIEID